MDNRNALIDASNGAKKTFQDYMSLNAFATVDFTKDLNLPGDMVFYGKLETD